MGSPLRGAATRTDEMAEEYSRDSKFFLAFSLQGTAPDERLPSRQPDLEFLMSLFRNNDVKKHLGRAKPRLVSNPAKPNDEAREMPSMRPDEESIRQQETKDDSRTSETV